MYIPSASGSAVFALTEVASFAVSSVCTSKMRQSQVGDGKEPESKICAAKPGPKRNLARRQSVRQDCVAADTPIVAVTGRSAHSAVDEPPCTQPSRASR